MSSRFRPEACLIALVLLATAAAGATVPPPAPTHGKNGPRPLHENPMPVLDDSTQAAGEMLAFVRGIYGGMDNYPQIAGARYFLTYRIPGPGGTTVRTWTETHVAWMHGAPRIRIDNATDSTVVIVNGDTTYVRRGGAWVTDPAIVAPARAQALDALWLVRAPRNVIESNLKRRLDPPFVPDSTLGVRVEYQAGDDRPEGTRLWMRFDPPGYALRNLRWYDPTTKGWFTMDFARDKNRYTWTWSELRTLRASDAAGTPGPVAWEATVEDFQLEGQMPEEVLRPAGATPVIVPAVAAAPAAPAAPAAKPGEESHGRR